MKRIILSISFIGLINSLNAQLFTKQTTTPFLGAFNSALKFFDCDNDGDDDVVILGYDGSGVSTNLYFNDGNGNYTIDNTANLLGVSLGDVASGDVDGDNDLDLIIMGGAGGIQQTKLYLNDGNGNFTLDVSNSFIGLYDGSVEFGDVDGDSDLDILICGSDDINNYSKLFLNNGFGSFTEDVSVPFTGVITGKARFVDIDNDNDKDVIIIGNDGTNLIANLYKNNGLGVFTFTASPFEGVIGGDVAFEDVDGDNDIDIFIMGEIWTGKISNCYLNDGNGVYTLDASNNFLGLSNGSVVIFDADNDNDMDIIICGSVNLIEYTKLYLNDGTGSFSLETATPISNIRQGGIAYSDIDNDTDLDFIICGYNGTDNVTELYINNNKVSGLNSISEINISLFPNPTGSITTISSTELIHNIRITSIDGKEVLKLENVNIFTIQLNLSKLDRGIFLVDVYSESSRSTTKLILK